LLEPHPSDRLSIGDRVVDIPLREIASAEGGEPVRVTLKSLGVLLALVAHAGRVVSREALLEWVWPDTMPTDDVVTQAITQLRKALGDERDHPRYIETIAKQGYRLIAPVQWLVDAAPAAVATKTANPPPVQPRASDAKPSLFALWRRKSLIAASVALVIALFAIGDRLDLRARAGSSAATPVSNEPRMAAPLAFQRIASQPMTEERPSLSPDGALVVYTRYVDGEPSAPLMLQTSSAMPPRALTEPMPKQFDLMPAWSPDGRQIAFVRRMGERCLVMSVPAAGGSARELGECLGGEPHPIAWFPDGSTLVGALRTGFSATDDLEKALYRMPLDRGRWERIAYARAPHDEDMSPSVSPDGRWIAFQRNVSLADLWRVPVSGGTPQRLTHLRTNIYGLAWSADSRYLLFSRYFDGKAVLSVLEIASGQITDYPAGANSVMFPTIARGGDALAFEVENSRSITRRVDLADGESAVKSSQVLFDSSGSNLLPSIAPDGTQVIFVSDRTGDTRLWWQDSAQADSLRSLDGLVPLPRFPVMWHADSRRALAIGKDPRGRFGVFEIEPRRGRIVRLAVPDRDPVHVSYHPDPNRLLVVADQGEGRLGATLYDRRARPWRVVARANDVAMAVFDPRHKRIVMASASTPEIRSADLDLRDVRTIDRVAIQRRNRSLVATPGGVRVMDIRDCNWYWRYVAADTGEADGRCLGGPSWWLESVSQAGAEPALYVSVVEQMQTDIGVLPMAQLIGPSAGIAERSLASD